MFRNWCRNPSGATSGKILSNCALAASLLSSPSMASASSATAGYISNIVVLSNGVTIFDTSGTRSTPPACQGPTVPRRFAIDSNTTQGQAKLAVLLTVYSLKRQVVVTGSGACSLYYDTETVDHFETIND